MKKRQRRKFSSLIAALLMIFSIVTPGIGSATSKGEVKTSLIDSKNVVKEKVNDRLLKQFKQDEQVTFLIKFKEQADTKKVAKIAQKSANKAGLSAQQAKLMQRSAVVSELKTLSMETQHNVKAYLEKEVKKGNAKDLKTFYIVNGIAVTATKEIAERVAKFKEVEKILPNETRQLFKPNKATTKEKTKVNVTPKKADDNVEWNVKKIGASAAWNLGIDGTGTVVASIDSGVQWDHPALKEKYRGYQPADDSVDHDFNWFDATAGREEPYDDQGHGTHVTGTMVGGEANGSNMIGVAPGAKWIAVKAFTASGGTDVDLLAAGEWILAPTDAEGNARVDMAPDVVNNSWGGGPGLDEWYREMVQNWRAAQIFPEFSAGNTNFSNPGGPKSIAAPANYPESFATGATDNKDKLASFSLQGPSPYDEIKPEIVAPGVNIRSSVPGNKYEDGWNGTSMAGPHVSAVAAMLRQANGSITVDEMEEILLSTATPLTDSNFSDSPNNGYGHGLVNAFDAVSSVVNGLGKVVGKIGKEGEDKEEPTFEHESISTAFVGMDLDLTIKVSDNVSVTTVVLEYKDQNGEWKNIKADRISGDYLSGEYKATIPGDNITEELLTYRWKINDYGNNEVVSEDYIVKVLPGITVGYFQDFESNPVGWTSFGEKDPWQWGVPTTGPKKAASGEKVFATNLEGNYENNTNATLVMPPIDLPEETTYLQFKQWYEMENNYDFGHVFISTDMEEWTQLQRINGTSGGWIDAEVDLSEYSGQRVYIGFNFRSDISVQKLGWYIDDVALSDTSLNSKTAKNKVKVQGEKKTKKEAVDPSKIQPKRPKLDKPPVKEEQIKPSLLPLHAEVSVLETGRSAFTNPANGDYSLMHVAGEYTLQADAYGYRSEQQSVNIAADETVEANFVLEELPQATLNGKITNSVTGEPVEGATLLLVEDAIVKPVQTGTDGTYSLTAYEGTYTLKVIAPHYYSQEIEVTFNNKTSELNIDLKPIISYPGGEIGYDNGEPDNARAFYDEGNGWAVKMSLPEEKEKALVTAGVFRFWTEDWPTPGGTEFQVEVWDASGNDGAPGKKIAGPFDGKALRNGEWTVVDLSEHGIMVEEDFYMVYIQTQPNPLSPGLATDETSPNAERSWQYVGGSWSQSPKNEGNYMIRARVNYEVETPTITSPSTGFITNDNKVTIEGTASPTTTVHIMNNEEEVESVVIDEDGKFSVNIELTEGENILKAVSSLDHLPAGESEPVTVILDREKPVLTIDRPKEGEKTNRETVTVEGSIEDANLDWVKVNGQQTKVENGKYAHRVMLENGENEIKVVARDKAGNKTAKTVKIFAKYTAPKIEHLIPDEDMMLETGQSVKITFDSEPGLKATFAIHMPLTNTGAKHLANATELPMMEITEGHYIGYWTVPKDTVANGAKIEVKVVDSYGNETRQLANGKLYLNHKK